MWGAIIGAAINAASSLYGGYKSSQAAEEANKKVAAMQAENQNWYDRRYNEDPLQRSSAQRVLTRTQEMLRDRNKAAAGRAAVMGGTEESVAAEKARNNEALAEAASPGRRPEGRNRAAVPRHQGWTHTAADRRRAAEGAEHSTGSCRCRQGGWFFECGR